MLSVFQVKQRPYIIAASQDYVTTPSTITTVRTAFRNELLTAEMTASSAALARTTTNLHIINEIGVGHQLGKIKKYFFILRGY
jgi:hypothetical protein